MLHLTKSGKLITSTENTEKNDLYKSTPQQLYFTDDEKPITGDWVINSHNEVHQLTPNDKSLKYRDTCRRIVVASAELGESLKATYQFERFKNKHEVTWILPKPSFTFMEKFIKLYNEGNFLITEVMVDYETRYFNIKGLQTFADPMCVARISLPKKDIFNTTTITKIDSWDEIFTIINDPSATPGVTPSNTAT